MRKLFIVFFFAFVLSIVASAAKEPDSDEHLDPNYKDIEITRGMKDRHSKELVRLHGRLLDRAIRRGELQERTAVALDNLMVTTAGELISRGYESLADEIYDKWNGKYRAIWFSSSRDIKDHPDAIIWLGTLHSKIEGVIGVSLCRALHVHDLYILNKALPVVFKPCSVDPLEYGKCFAGKIDTEEEFGAVSVIDYWLTYGICAGATMGTGMFMICGIVGDLSEYAFTKLLAPPLAAWVWENQCGG